MPDSPSVVLVHGAWHGPWCWSRVEGPLRERGFDLHALKLPSAGHGGEMYGDARLVRETIDQLDGPVLLVAHSYGGVVSTQAAAGAPNVGHILYVTAFMLDEGESLLATVGGLEPDWLAISEDGREHIPTRPAEIFYNDCSDEVAAEAAAQLQPQTRESFSQPVTEVGWRDVPTTYVICERDHAIPVPAQEMLSQRAGAVRRLDASHSPFLSKPDEIVEIIAELAG
jgi:pimeloyl-ACP methyl ester carboxylesterase